MRRGCLLIFLWCANVQGKEQLCTQKFLEKKSPAMQGLIAMSCPNLKVNDAAQTFKEFFNRANTQHWKNYNWPLSAAQFKAAIVATEKMYAFKKLPSIDLSDRIVGNFVRKKIPDSQAFLRFLLRVYPCSDASDAEHLSLVLTSEFNVDASKLMELAISEEKNIANLDRQKVFEGCDPSLLSKETNPYPIIKHSVSALMQTWQDLGVPRDLTINIQNAKKKLRGPEAVYLFSLLNGPNR